MVLGLIYSIRVPKCCNNKLWGTGTPIQDENCLTPSNWTSQGILGKILENVRSSIRDIMGINKHHQPQMTTPPPLTKKLHAWKPPTHPKHERYEPSSLLGINSLMCTEATWMDRNTLNYIHAA